MHVKKYPLRRLIQVLIASVALQFGIFSFGSWPAFAAPTSLTVVSTGGVAEGSGWSFSSGELAATSAVSINASDIEAKLSLASLTLVADSITINTDITTTSSNSLTFKSTGDVKAIAGVDISTNGGNVTLQANSADAGVGQIWLGNLAGAGGSITTNGGHIFLGGGSNLSTGFAMASTTFEATKVSAGIAMYGFGLNASGGNITLRGSGSVSANARAILIEQNTAATRSSIQTTGSGEVSITGDGSPLQFTSNRWGPTFSGLNITTGAGDIRINGKAGTGAGNARGIVFSNTNMTSTTGNILIYDTTDGSSPNYSGMYLGGTISKLSTGGEIVIKADEYISDGTLEVVGPSAALKPYTGDSFTESRPLGFVDADACADFTFGQTGNTTAMSINKAITFGGNATFIGGAISFSEAQNASSGLFRIFASGVVTQSAKIEASSLKLSGTGSFSLTHVDNDFSTVAGGLSADRLGNVSIKDKANGLVIGTVDSTAGLYSSGNINVETIAGNISIQAPVDSSSASGDSVLIYANKAASGGTAGNGNVSMSGSGSVNASASARALIYSGSSLLSSGLVGAVGGRVNTRAEYDATTSLATLSLGATGKFAIFRVSTAINRITYEGNNETSGTVPAFTESSSSQVVEGNSGNLSKTGFTFGGWNTSADGQGTSYSEGSTINPSGDMTLFAIWTANPSGGSASAPPVIGKVQAVEIMPGSKSSKSILKVKLADVPGSVAKFDVRVRIFDFSGRLVEVLNVPVEKTAGTLEIDLNRSLGEFNVDASTITATAVTDAISASPLMVKKINYVLPTNGKKLTLLGKRSGTVAYFSANSSKLTYKAKLSLAELTEQIKNSNSRLALTGFVSQWNKGKKVEQRLAEQRAQAVAKYLKGLGVSNWIYFAGYGVLSKDRSEPNDRKVEIRLLD